MAWFFELALLVAALSLYNDILNDDDIERPSNFFIRACQKVDWLVAPKLEAKRRIQT